MAYEAVILDIDGTLWNASAASAEGWNEGLSRMGIDKRVTADEVSSVAGRPYAQCVETLLPGLQAEYPSLLKTMDACETEKIRQLGGAFFDGVLQGVKTLSGRYKVGLVSNCQDWYMKFFLQFSGLREFFCDVDCYGMSGVPKGDMLRAMMERNSISSAIYVGDTSGDAAAAESAGTDFAFVSYGFGTVENPEHSFDTFPDLAAFLLEKPL